MKRALSMIVLAAAILLTVSARAEIPHALKQPIYDRQGIYDFETLRQALDLPEAVTETADTAAGLVEWALPGGEIIAAPGILAQRDFDLDADGLEEWLTLRVEEDAASGLPALWLDVYEQAGGLELADSARLCDWVSECSDCFWLDLYSHGGAPRVLLFQPVYFAAPGMEAAVFAYADGKITTVFRASMAEGEDGHPDYSCVVTDEQGASALEDGWDAFRARLDDLADGAGLRWSPALPVEPVYWDDLYSDYALRPEAEALTLAESLGYALVFDDSGVMRLSVPYPNRFVVTTGMAGLRPTPDASADAIAAVDAGVRLPFLGEIEPGQEGVEWYLADRAGQPLWVSSEASVLQ